MKARETKTEDQIYDGYIRDYYDGIPATSDAEERAIKRSLGFALYAKDVRVAEMWRAIYDALPEWYKRLCDRFVKFICRG